MILDISTIEGYEIATALRGPDYETWNESGEKLTPDPALSLWKRLVTGVIRYYAGVRIDRGITTSPEEAHTLWENLPDGTKASVQGWSQRNTHVTAHANTALYYLDSMETSTDEFYTWLKDIGLV